MIDMYSWVAIVLRLLAAGFFLSVFVKQYREYQREPHLRRLQIYLILTVALLFIANGLSIFVNFFRQEDGNLLRNIRHIAQILNATSTLGAAYTYYLIYKYRER